MSLLDMTNRRDPPKAVVEKTIYNASLKGHYRVVKELLNCNVNPNCKCDLGTPIYAAVVADCLDVVKLLVDRGAEYRRVVGGFSPVFASCVEGRMKILRYLVNAGADLRFIKNPPLVFTACMQVSRGCGSIFLKLHVLYTRAGNEMDIVLFMLIISSAWLVIFMAYMVYIRFPVRGYFVPFQLV